MEQFRNPNGSYNGIKALAAWSGLSEAEVKWTAERMKALIKSGVPAKQAIATLKEEAKSRPWLGQQPGEAS